MLTTNGVGRTKEQDDMANPTPDDALREVIEALAMAKDGPYFASSIDGATCVHRALDTKGGAGVMVDGETWTLPDAIAIAASVNFLRTHADRIRLALDTLARVEAAVVVEVRGSEYGASNTFLKVAVHGVHADGFSLRARYRLVLEGEG